MKRQRAWIGVGVLWASMAWPCAWDSDTIRQENFSLPEAPALITGAFRRHSQEFYYWRISNRLNRIEADPNNPHFLDDLGVAYDKTGQHDFAIATALKTEGLFPGRYETAANLATFYFHAGRWEEGLPWIDKALEINPQAHFGRERYQKLLVEYMLQCRELGVTGPPFARLKDASADATGSMPWTNDFAEFLIGRGVRPGDTKRWQEAILGVLGMMRFGRHDSPALLEATGVLFAQGEKRDHLNATRALLHAAILAPQEASREQYLAMARWTYAKQDVQTIPFDEFTKHFDRELTEGRQFAETYLKQEDAWIAAGKNPEEEQNLIGTPASDYAIPANPSLNPPSDGFDFVHRLLTAMLYSLPILLVAVCIVKWRRSQPFGQNH